MLIIPGRTHTDCIKQWTTIQQPLATRSLWEKEEDEVLKEAVKEHGNKEWDLVALYFSSVSRSGGRTEQQCKNRWQLLFSHIDTK